MHTHIEPLMEHSEPWLHPQGKYRYMAQLKQLRATSHSSTSTVDPRLAPIITPLIVEAWEHCLRVHPDQDFAAYIIDGLRHGVTAGCDPESKLQPAKRNNPSADDHPEVVSAYIEKEVVAGRILGPFKPKDLEPPVQISRFRVIPKGHTPGKWRLILDLSFLDGESVNDGIQPDHCSIKYLKIEEIAQALLHSGPYTQMAKIDIRNAYRIIPVAPGDRVLLGMSWKVAVYVDTVLPFGLRSSADALLWILRQNGIRNIFHYLDDFLCLRVP